MSDFMLASDSEAISSDDADDVAAEEVDRWLRDAGQAMVLGPDACQVLSASAGYSMPEPLWGLTAFEELVSAQKVIAELGATAVVGTTGLCDEYSLEVLKVQATSEYACERALRAARAGGPRFVLGSIECGDQELGDARRHVESVSDEVRLLLRGGVQGLVVSTKDGIDRLSEELQGIADANASLLAPRAVIIDCSGHEQDVADALERHELGIAEEYVAAVLVSSGAYNDKSLMSGMQRRWPQARIGLAVDTDAAEDNERVTALLDGSPLLRFSGKDALKATAVAAARLGI